MGPTPFPGGLALPALSNTSLTAAETGWLDFLSDSLGLEEAGAEEVLPSVPFLSLSLFVDWDRKRDVRTCELLLCLLTWEVSKSMDSSVEGSLLLSFPCPDWFGSALAASWARASSKA